MKGSYYNDITFEMLAEESVVCLKQELEEVCTELLGFIEKDGNMDCKLQSSFSNLQCIGRPEDILKQIAVMKEYFDECEQELFRDKTTNEGWR